MDNKELRDVYDALTSGVLDTSDIEPYMDTILEALQVAGVKIDYLQQEQMVGQMVMATAVKVRLDMDLPKADIVKFIDDFLNEYKEWSKEHRMVVLKTRQ